MRAISLVNRLEFDFNGNVLRNAITLRDVDNDGNYELIVANESGDVTIFKGKNKWQTISNLGFVCCLAVGDILNQNKNCLVIITGDGWCYIYSSPDISETELDEPEPQTEQLLEEGVDRVDGQILSGESFESQSSDSTANTRKSRRKLTETTFLQRIHVQRIPANTKYILLDDIDGDGCIEMVLGLTDRVVRSYRWFEPQDVNTVAANILNSKYINDNQDKSVGKLVALNKWECAKQIGSVTLHHASDGKPSLLIAQPGGTFMRIRYQSEESIEISDSSNSVSEYLTGSSVDYQFLGLSRMRNQNISTEIVGNLRTKRRTDEALNAAANDDNNAKPPASKGTPYAVATLDGTIMLVQDESILWAIAVDHQIFALTKLDVTGNGVDDLVACSWDGHTYILDQEKHSVRFQLDESVQAFDSGFYTLVPGETPVTSLVYVTFRNKILLYYDLPLQNMICKKFNVNLENINDIFVGEDYKEKSKVALSLDKHDKRKLVEFILYGVDS